MAKNTHIDLPLIFRLLAIAIITVSINRSVYADSQVTADVSSGNEGDLHHIDYFSVEFKTPEGAVFFRLHNDDASNESPGTNAFNQNSWDYCAERDVNFENLRNEPLYTQAPELMEELLIVLEEQIAAVAMCDNPIIPEPGIQIPPVNEEQELGDSFCSLNQTNEKEAFSSLGFEAATLMGCTSNCGAEASGTFWICGGKCHPDYDSDFWGPAKRCTMTGTTSKRCNCFWNARDPATGNRRPLVTAPPDACDCDSREPCMKIIRQPQQVRLNGRVRTEIQVFVFEAQCVRKECSYPKCECLTESERRKRGVGEYTPGTGW